MYQNYQLNRDKHNTNNNNNNNNSENWYRYQPKAVMLPSYGPFLPDITVKDKREKTCKLINFKISADKNFSLAEFEELSKYKVLEIKDGKLWHMKTVTVPVVIGVLGTIIKGTEKHLEQIPGILLKCKK